VILFIGRIAKEKSIDVVIRSMSELTKKLPTAKFLIVGDGPLKKDLEALAKLLHIEENIIFAGEQPWETISKYYHLSNVFVSASVTETQGLTFAEAMASGTPVVAKQDKNLEGMVIDGMNGRIFENNEDLAHVLYDILSNKEKYDYMSQKSMEMVEPYSSSYFGDKIEKLYMEMLK
jgi:1,2-diacylglycerol 3-alpha-glucosyltransferase